MLSPLFPGRPTGYKAPNYIRLHYTKSTGKLEYFSAKKDKETKKLRVVRHGAFSVAFIGSHRTGDLTGTEASGADVHMSGGTIHDRLDALHIGLPGTVGTTVGVGHLNAENNALIAEFTLGHFAYLLASKYTQIMEHRQI